MSTSMLDALADEAKAITLLGAEASRLAIEAVRRSNLLTQQIQRLAEAEISAPPSISAGAEESEFLAFQAEHFPDLVFGTSNEIQESPGIHPAAQDDGQGNQGSGEAAPGDAARGVPAQPEQVVAASVSGEQGSAVCKDPETGPDANQTLRDRVLSLYARTTDEPRKIATVIGTSPAVVNEIIRLGRNGGDRRAAAGDVVRDIGVEVALAARAGRNRPKPSAPPVPADAVEESDTAPVSRTGEICQIRLSDCAVTHGEKSIVLARHEMRMVLALNSGAPITLEDMLQAAGVMTGRRLTSEVAKLNPRIAKIGVLIVKNSAGEFQLSTDR